MGPRVRPLIVLGALMALVVGLGGLSLLGDVVVGAGPLLAIATVLLAGRYPGERTLTAALQRRRGATLRAALTRTRPVPARRGLASSLQRSVPTLRGPPLRATAA